MGNKVDETADFVIKCSSAQKNGGKIFMIRKMLDFLILRKFDKVTTDSFFSIWAIFKGLDEECSNFRTFFVPLVIIALIIGGLFLSFLATV